jgi:putative membrane protein
LNPPDPLVHRDQIGWAMLASMTLLIRWLLLACALVLLTQWNLGVQVDNFTSAMWAALVMGLLNAFVRPLLILLTLPVTLLTLGLFLFVINALTFQMASSLLEGFHVTGFWQALLGSILYSLFGLVIDTALQRMMGRPQKG